jgi:hypothetical protein
MLLQSQSTPTAALSWPVLVGVAVSALPTLAAWRAGRLDRHDPIGQVGLVWGLMFLTSLSQYALVAAGLRSVALAMPILVVIVLPVLIVSPLLTWIGPRAAARRVPVLAGLAVWSLGVVVALGTGREARLFLRCTSYTTVAILAAWAMAAQSRRSAQGSDPGAEGGGPWLGAGHMLYFLTGAVGNALIEALVSRSWDALLQVYRAQHLTYGIAMVSIAWGIRASARRPVRAPVAPAPAARFSDTG